MNENEKFAVEKTENIAGLGCDNKMSQLGTAFLRETAKYKYSYNFEWLGRPIIQFPQDMLAMQEIIWEVKPDLIIETGIAHGGSLIYYASILELLSVSGYTEGKVLGIDIDIRDHNRKAIESHPMFKNIKMIQGSSIASEVIEQVKECATGKSRILVVLDPKNRHDHALAELEAYAPLVSIGSYCVVFDTAIEDMPADFFPDRPWGPGNNPKTAVREYLRTHSEFEIDKSIQHKLLITVAPDGYLKRIS